jgi:hypothetical protein
MALPVLAGVALWKVVAAAVATGIALWAVVQIAKIVIGVIEDVAEAIGAKLPLVLGGALLVWWLAGAPNLLGGGRT